MDRYHFAARVFLISMHLRFKDVPTSIKHNRLSGKGNKPPEATAKKNMESSPVLLVTVGRFRGSFRWDLFCEIWTFISVENPRGDLGELRG